MDIYEYNIAAYDNGDWPKATLDFEATNAVELRAELNALGESIPHFKTLPAYYAALASGRYPWLADL